MSLEMFFRAVGAENKFQMWQIIINYYEAQ